MVIPTAMEEKKLYRSGFTTIAGIDEAGRGSWAGPIVAAAVVLPQRFRLPGLKDSKLLTPKERERLYDQIMAQASGVGIGLVSRKKIDRIGLGQANILVLRKSVYRLPIEPDFIMIDGFAITFRKVASRQYVQGDQRVASIAAASIIAKVYRDNIMRRYHKKYPYYNFHHNKGYGTKAHHLAIIKYGVCDQHRRSFQPIAVLLQKDL